MGAAFTRKPASEEEDTDTLDKQKLSKLDQFQQSRQTTMYLELYRLYKQRLPYLIEDYLGLNMSYYISKQIPNNLIVSLITFLTTRRPLSGG